MKKTILLLIAAVSFLGFSGCLTPPSFMGEHGKKTGQNSDITYKVTDYKDGFRVDMTYFKFEYEGVEAATTFDARYKLKQLALWIAEARKRKLKPINIEDLESRHYFNSVTRHAHWRGHIRVYYAD
ncbi:MAG: hypothetical protein PHV59_00850 [Victivallales bacterium]|nr:hypothetical protein [Victivallales bacterium]